MKAFKILSITFLMLVVFNGYSAVIVVNQIGTAFSPSTLNVNVGDVVKWVWHNGDHTTTSTSVPLGAASWDAPLTSTNTIFEYTVTVSGSYSYVCKIHESMGMVGSFTASISSGVTDNDQVKDIFAFPNPAKSFVNLRSSVGGEIQLSDILGKTIKKVQLNELQFNGDSYRLELSDLANGVYVISFLPPNNKKRVSVKIIKE